MKIAILGSGVMGSAFARQLVKQGHELFICDRTPEKGRALADELGAAFNEDPKEAAKEAEIILLAVKPNGLEKIAEQLAGLKGQILFSILAGTSVADLQALFPGMQIVRAMPNLALIHGESVIAVVESEELDPATQAVISGLLEGMGMVFWTEEEKIDAITALAGSGPAFIIAIVEALVEGGIMMGLNAQDAKCMALQMIRGAVSLLEHHEGHPGEVRWKISAPKGTTIAGMHAFEKDGVRSGVIHTLLATYEKSKEMR